MDVDNSSDIDLVEANSAGISVLLGRYAFTWNPTFLGGSVFCLVGRKSRLDRCPEDGICAPTVDLHVLHGSITIQAGFVSSLKGVTGNFNRGCDVYMPTS